MQWGSNFLLGKRPAPLGEHTQKSPPFSTGSSQGGETPCQNGNPNVRRFVLPFGAAFSTRPFVLMSWRIQIVDVVSKSHLTDGWGSPAQDIHDGQEHKRSVQGPDTEAQERSPPL
jgi:hypothetical protein